MARRDRKARRSRPEGRGYRGVVWLVNSVLVGVGGVFVITASVLVTGIAAAAAVAVAVTVTVMTGR
jgi:hypothetical protein